VDQAIEACGGDMRSTIRALIVANEYLETGVGEVMKAVSQAYAAAIHCQREVDSSVIWVASLFYSNLTGCG
jgi:hypothetical protein